LIGSEKVSSSGSPTSGEPPPPPNAAPIRTGGVWSPPPPPPPLHAAVTNAKASPGAPARAVENTDAEPTSCR